MDTADLEIGLHRRDAEGYQLELRLSRPDSPTDDRVGPDTPVEVHFDKDRLQSLMLNDAAYGKLLGESLFESPEIRQEFHTTRKVVESHNWALRIRLFIAPNASELQSLRWETLRDPSEDHCLLTAEQLLFSRYLSSSDWRPVERRPQTDLRALLAIANPSDIAEYNMAVLNVTETLDRAKSGFGNIPVTELASGGTATRENVITQLREDYDILYLICHGMLVDNEPWLWLEAASGETQRVSGTAFCTRLKELKHRPRLVVLASCQSAGTGKLTPPGEAEALTALGPRLAEAGIPAVIAMQGTVSIKTIDTFMPVFFQELQRDGQIDRAMSVARGMVRERFDWWMPVLFMRLKDGRLWGIPEYEEGLRRILRVLIPPERMPEATPQEAQKPSAIRLRSEPTTVSEKDFKEAFRLDKNWRPSEDIQNDYEVQGKEVVDHATGLIWQKSGANKLTYEDAQKYVEERNRLKFFAGNDWRLPTIPELMSLLERTEKNGDLYIDPIFDPAQRWCWSADRLPKSEGGSSGAAWCVIFDRGVVFWKGVKDIGYVRCVRSRD